MRITDIFLTAGSNLFRNKTRSTLTIVAIFIGTVTLTLTSGIGDGIKSYLNKQIGSMGESNVLITMQKGGGDPTSTQGSDEPQEYDPSKVKAQASGISAPGVGGTGSSFLLTKDDIKKIEADKDVVSVDPMLSLSIDYITNGDKKYVIETSSLPTDGKNLDLVAGGSFDNSIEQYQVILPSPYIKTLNYSDAKDAIGKKVDVSISDQNQNSKIFNAIVVGVVNKSLVTSDNLMMNERLLNDSVDFQSNGKPESQKNIYSAVLTKYKDELTDTQVSDLKNRLGDIGYSSSTVKDQQQLIFSIIDGIVLVLNMFGVVALIAASFGIINTLYMAVQERTKEIGLMKAVGMRRSKIFALFSIEAALLGFFGSLFGVLTASGIGYVINKIAAEGLLKDFEGLQLLTFNPVSIITIIAIIVTIAFLAGTFPARKASRLDPIEALRYE